MVDCVMPAECKGRVQVFFPGKKEYRLLFTCTPFAIHHSSITRRKKVVTAFKSKPIVIGSSEFPNLSQVVAGNNFNLYQTFGYYANAHFGR